MRNSLFLLLLLSVLSLTGCDTFRRIAGRPTSGEIEAMRQELQAAEREKEVIRDSLQLIIDSLNATPDDSPAASSAKEAPVTASSAKDAPVTASSKETASKSGEDIKLSSVEEKGGLFYTQDLEYRYYVILGSYKDERYLNAMIKNVSDAGYLPVVIKFANGYTSVGVAAENSLYEATYTLRGLRREKFCPDDVWILYNKK